MEELERLTKLVEQLVKQVEIMAETLRLSMERGEQIYKSMEAQLPLFPALVDQMTLGRENFEIAMEALQQAVGGIDQAADEVAKAISAQLQIVNPALQALAKAAVEQSEK